jgi:hypothetical protein
MKIFVIYLIITTILFNILQCHLKNVIYLLILLNNLCYIIKIFIQEVMMLMFYLILFNVLINIFFIC